VQTLFGRELIRDGGIDRSTGGFSATRRPTAGAPTTGRERSNAKPRS
jgi:hypothetical protein